MMLLLPTSDLRQIPDNQEVFLSPDSETSLVIEILSMVDEGQAGIDLNEAIKCVIPAPRPLILPLSVPSFTRMIIAETPFRYHFNSIAHDNSSLSTQVLTSPTQPLPSTQQTTSTPQAPIPVILKGTQTIHKFSYNPTGASRPGHEDDIPDEVWIGVALWRCWWGKKKADLVASVNVNLTSGGGDGQAERERLGIVRE
jgi:hypothetical protein